jgi:hypothetical protein
MTGIKAKLQKLRLTHWSTYTGFMVWGAAGYGYSPSLGSLVTHILIIPPLVALTIFLAHRRM